MAIIKEEVIVRGVVLPEGDRVTVHGRSQNGDFVITHPSVNGVLHVPSWCVQIEYFEEEFIMNSAGEIETIEHNGAIYAYSPVPSRKLGFKAGTIGGRWGYFKLIKTTK